MRPTMRRTVSLLAPLLVLAARPLAAQADAEWKARAIAGMMTYRAAVLGDTATRFDACSVARQLGVEAADLGRHLAEPAAGLLGPCLAVSERSMHRVVLVDSLTRGPDGEITAYATVVLGEWVHREDYSFVNDASRPRVAVREVRLWGAVQSYPRRPPRGTGGN